MKYKYFNPEDIIKQYFYELVVSGHNENSFHSYRLRESIENLRNLILKHFSLQGYTVSFVPNLSHALNLMKLFVNSSNVDSLLIHKDNLDQDFDFSTLKKLPGKFIHVHLDKLIYKDDYSGIDSADFFTLDPSISFYIYGVAIFIFRKDFLIKPINLGSSYPKGLPHSLECGTQNYANLLLLESYFDILHKHKQDITQKISENMHTINFNLNYKTI